nr:DUF3850 domain-containing protein [Alicyclobacillus mengziensis]
MRKDDRGYQVGDKLILAEWDHVAEDYTGRTSVRIGTGICRVTGIISNITE